MEEALIEMYLAGVSLRRVEDITEALWGSKGAPATILMLVCARLRHVAGTQWGNKKYMNMQHLEATLDDASIGG